MTGRDSQNWLTISVIPKHKHGYTNGNYNTIIYIYYNSKPTCKDAVRYMIIIITYKKN